MYLSRVKVDDENFRKVRALNSLDAFHDWVERCFPEEFEAQERKRKLWRLDTCLLYTSPSPRDRG